MEQQGNFAAFIPLLIMTVPIVIINIFIAIRKGKSPVLYGALSLIPVIGFYFGLYLASLTDKSISEKVDRIITLLESR